MVIDYDGIFFIDKCCYNFKKWFIVFIIMLFLYDGNRLWLYMMCKILIIIIENGVLVGYMSWYNMGKFW